MSHCPWLIYGAYGYTGRRIAQEAVARGMHPIVAGRDPAKTAALAQELACPRRAFPLSEARANLAGVSLVLNCAGPFSRTAEPMMDACLATGVHYLDITGEIDVIEAAAARSDQAAAASIVLIPAVGFDVVPSDCLAAMLAPRLPSATLLQLAFSGTGRLSPGTARTVIEALPKGGRVRQDGRIVAVPVAWKTIEIDLGDRRQAAVTIPWGDVASAWHSTGIPNVETYMMMRAAMAKWMRWTRFATPLLKLPLPIAWVRAALNVFMAGPEAPGARLWARVCDPHGRHAEALMATPEAYRLTVLSALAAVDRVLAGLAKPGFFTPSQAFGPQFALSLPGVSTQTP